MTWPLIIAIAGPVRGKGAGRAAVAGGGHARVYQDAKTRSYEAQIRFAAQQAMGEQPPTAESVKVRIEARLPIPTTWSKRKRDEALNGVIRPTVKPDANNISKSLDSLNGVVWVDDKQIVEEWVVKYYAETPGLIVRVAPLRLGEVL